MTSKCHNVDDLSKLHSFGYRGEALASLKESCSSLVIETRHFESQQTYSCKCRKDEINDITILPNLRPSTGCTVTIYDVFHNFPVRKKVLQVIRELSSLKEQIHAIALIHCNVSISVKNDQTQNCIIKIPKSETIIHKLSFLYGEINTAPLKYVSNNHKSIKIDGFISPVSQSNKPLQFVFVNKRIVKQTRLHKYINTLINSCASKSNNNNRSEDLTHTLQKAPNRQCVFIVNITCPYDIYDITFEPQKTMLEFENWDRIFQITHKMLQKYFVPTDSSRLTSTRLLHPVITNTPEITLRQGKTVES